MDLKMCHVLVSLERVAVLLYTTATTMQQEARARNTKGGFFSNK